MNLENITKKLDAYERLMRLDKPIGILLLLWPTLWALWLASSRHSRLDYFVDICHWRGADAQRGLRDERHCGPQI